MITPTIQDAIDQCLAAENATVRQYGRNLERACDLVARHRHHDLRQDIADVSAYRDWMPRFDNRSAPLLERIAKAGLSQSTYKQYAEDGRRAIEHLTGDLRARIERKSRRDDWHHLIADLESLVETKLLALGRLKSIRNLADICRSQNLSLTGLNGTALLAIHKNVPAAHWSKVVKGANALDWLRMYDTLSERLPERALALDTISLRRSRSIPAGMSSEIADWIRVATTTIPSSAETEVAQSVLAERHSEGAIGVFSAALGAFVSSIARRQEITHLNTINGLFTDENIEAVLIDWISAHRKGEKSAFSPRTIYRYADCVKLALFRNGHHSAADKIARCCKDWPTLQEGRKANEYMSAETEAWCRGLIGDPAKMAVFETQHVTYFKVALQALNEAEAAKLDLQHLSDPKNMAELPRRLRRTAKRLLRRVRVFGVSAAYAAIALEGAPFRKANILGLSLGGAQQTMFDNRGLRQGFTILIPNELLKNGKSLTDRGATIPPVPLCGREPGQNAEEIISFYLKRIRPLFPGAKQSPYLFLSLVSQADSMVHKTFDNWLLEASNSLGIPMTSHNFRHGYCSIEIKHDPNCIEDLAHVLGDLPETVRRYYAFVDRVATLRRHQALRSERRSQYRIRDVSVDEGTT
ncbi:site-specific integrase [Pseudoprimorskyibacter insulae]|uniref:Uncharacterized protein n=1 Tax=Pseudoprimorskyibacter insulae TaxID=1695997 RepID=A0A2R8APX9_9RHOB|nr:site-specific integrase [Pseudoprimorskyibacter insulae]SPF78101.1 hypothetical protein PRI8871_00692 [Pseudoprimorskyibacter insulae]